MDNVVQQAEKSKFAAVKIVEAHLIRRSGDLKRAAQLYDALLKADEKNLIVLRARAEVARELSDPATAFTLIKRAAELVPADDPQGPVMWIELGGMAMAGGKNAEAAEAYERAAKLKPADIDLARQVTHGQKQVQYAILGRCATSRQ